MKVGHLADLHLGFRAYHKAAGTGVNLREFDVAKAFVEALGVLKDRDIKVLLLAGDIFHQVRPPNAIITFAFKQFLELQRATDCEIVMVAGNHETPKTSETGNILQLFEMIPKSWVVYNRSEAVQVAGGRIRVLCVPHNGVLQRPKLEPDPEVEFNILLMHAAHAQYKFYAQGGHQIHSDDVHPEKWDYVALGDFHSHTVLAPNMIYPGGIERTTSDIWAEAEDEKGLVIYDLEAKSHEFVLLTSPRTVVDLEPLAGAGKTSEELTAEITAILDEVDVLDKIVRLQVVDVDTFTQRHLDHALLRAYRTSATHLHLVFRRPKRVSAEGTMASDPAKRLTLEEEMEDFFAHRYKPDDDKLPRKELAELAAHYLGNVQRPDVDE